MSRPTRVAIFFFTQIFALIIAVARPSWTNDSNQFFDDFVGADFLSIMGIIVTITLASAANMYIEVNRFEEKRPTVDFTRTRDALRTSAFFLVSFFAASFIIVVLKSYASPFSPWTAYLNTTSMLVIGYAILTLYDIADAAFSLPPAKPPSKPPT